MYPESESFILPLHTTAIRMARNFAQCSPQSKAKQVEQNTLAVYLVHTYLEMMGIPNEIEAGDSWDPVTRLLSDVADLVIPGKGRLECRPICSGDDFCFVPPEVWDDRIGYVVVELDPNEPQGYLVGFVPKVEQSSLPRRALLPLENLLDHLNTLDTSSEHLVLLRRWLNHLYDQPWQSPDQVLNPRQNAFRFRSRAGMGSASESAWVPQASRGKLLDLGLQLQGQPLALVIDLTPCPAGEVSINLQIHPTGQQPYLPPQLTLMVLDEKGETFLEAQSRQRDNYIQLAFSGEADEQFSIKIAYGTSSLIESFKI